MKTTNTAPMGSYVPHDDSYFPSLVQVERKDNGTYITPEAINLAGKVSERFHQIAIHGDTLPEQPTKIDEGTYMSTNAVNLAQALHRDWLIQLRKPVPSQEFPLDRAA
jgi:hypothetical protein